MFTPEITPRQLEAAKLYYGALSGDRRDQYTFSEALAKSDLPIQLQPTLIADFLDEYDKREQKASKFTKVETIDQVNTDVEYKDFAISQEVPESNNGERFIGGLPKKNPEQPTPKLSFSGSKLFLRTSVREEGIDIQWETIYNSRGAKIDIIPKAFQRFADDASDSDEVAAVKLLVTANGINTGVLGTTGHVAKSGTVTNPPLTKVNAVQVLADAVALSRTHVVNGRRVSFNDYALVVDPVKVPEIKQALTGGQITILPGSAGGVSMTQTVDLGAQIEVVGFDWLSIANAGSKEYWFLIPRDGRRKGLVLVKAVGEETPTFWIEGSNALIYPGGGASPELQGKFTNETWSAKTRYVVDGGVISNGGIVYSTGAGS